jgi:putative intracellular protease/amidase
MEVPTRVLNAHYDFNDSPELDYLIIPGGRGRREQVNNERLIAVALI